MGERVQVAFSLESVYNNGKERYFCVKEAAMPVILGQLLLIALIGYLWGAIPFGHGVGILLRGKDFDIRTYGSHKIGATNVQRTLGTGPAVLVLVLDLLKGAGPTLIATYVPFFHILGWGATVAGLAAILGHRFPVFIGFQGGRSVAVGSAALLVISPLVLLFAVIALLITIGITRYVSLGSIVGCLTTMVCGLIFFFIEWVSLPGLVFMIVAPALIIIFHADNIGRLLAGKERKLGQKEEVARASPTGTSSDDRKGSPYHM